MKLNRQQLQHNMNFKYVKLYKKYNNGYNKLLQLNLKSIKQDIYHNNN